MRLYRYAGFAALGGLLLSGCAKGHLTAYRPEIRGLSDMTPRARPLPVFGSSKGHPTAFRPEIRGLSDMTPRARPLPNLEPHQQEIVGPDVIVLKDGTPLYGEVASVTPTEVHFADGLTAPRVQVASIEFAAPQAAPSLGTGAYDDAIALADGSVLEAALVRLDGDKALVVVFDADGGYSQVRSASDITAVTFRDRRDSACSRAVLVAGGQPHALAPSAEVSSGSFDTVFVFWRETETSRMPDRVVRCIDRGAGRASACTVSTWTPSASTCAFRLDGEMVVAIADSVADLSESTRFYYALRDGERTLGTSERLQRDKRYDIRAPVRLATGFRGEAHYLHRSWREEHDEGIHSVEKK